jgi:hypothetical protein
MAEDVLDVAVVPVEARAQVPSTLTPEFLATLTYETLDRKHPEYDKWRYRWDDYRLMYKGGEEFMVAAGMPVRIVRASSVGGAAGVTASAQLIPGSQTRIPRRFLWQLEGEPNASYLSRLERAFYVGYTGPVIDYFAHYLFSQKPVIRPASAKDGGETPDAPDWFAPFDRDATGGGLSFFDFLRDQFKELLITQRCGWLIGSPTDTSQMTQAEAEARGVDGIVLEPYKADEILDWEKDQAGELLWVIVRKIENRREFPLDRVKYETIRYIDRNLVATWEAHETSVAGSTTGGHDVIWKGAVEHGAGVVPFVMPEIPEGLWVANKLGGWQLELFNQMNILSRGELLSCFIQPTITTNDDTAESRIFGEGNLLRLRAGDGKQPPETYAWSSANIDPLRFLGERLKEKRDEGYRIVHQMSLAIDGDSATAVARSGLSKIEERRATEIILTGFGGYARHMATRTLNIISKLLGDNVRWVLVGFDNFQVSSLEEELETAALVQTLGIKSRTFNERMQSKMVRRILDHEDEATLATIDDEICDEFDEAEQAEDDKQDALTQMATGAVPGTPPDGGAQPAKVSPAQPAAPGQPPTPPKATPGKPPAIKGAT